MDADRRLHVAVAAVLDAAGRVLLARRPAHVHQGDLWEFPGGKLEPGESVEQALARELWEEVHIRPLQARPLIQVPHRYPDRHVLLDVWAVSAYAGTPHGRQGQPLAWVTPRELPNYPLPAANRAIARAVSLPSGYAISGAADEGVDVFLRSLGRCLERGVRMLQLRPLMAEDDPSYRELIRRAIARAHAVDVRVLLNAAPERALELGADGVHLSAQRAAQFRQRPLPETHLVGVSCHDGLQLQHAAAIDADFAVLSPLAPTPSHPGAPALGWRRFSELVAQAVLPVYALGGVGPGDLAQVWRCGGQGVAGIRAFWD
jgi:8-oxo-dGTP diphosphatase